MTHKLKVGAGLVAVVAALGVGSAVLQKRAVAAANGTQAPRFEVNPLWPKPLPNHWVIGNTIGVSVDSKITSGSFIARVRSKPRKATRITNPHRAMLHSGPAGSRIRQEGNLLESLGRPRRKAMIGRFEPRNHGRLQRQRLDRRQWPRHRRRAARHATAGRRARRWTVRLGGRLLSR